MQSSVHSNLFVEMLLRRFIKAQDYSATYFITLRSIHPISTHQLKRAKQAHFSAENSQNKH